MNDLVPQSLRHSIGTAVDHGSWGRGDHSFNIAVHRLDAAHLFRLGVERGAARAYYHGVAEEGVVFRRIAEVIGRRLNIPVVSKTFEEAAAHFGWFAHFAAIDVPASSKQTQEQLGWRPKQAGLIADLERASYFST